MRPFWRGRSEDERAAGALFHVKPKARVSGGR
jgi:hypothetical protein